MDLFWINHSKDLWIFHWWSQPHGCYLVLHHVASIVPKIVLVTGVPVVKCHRCTTGSWWERRQEGRDQVESDFSHQGTKWWWLFRALWRPCTSSHAGLTFGNLLLQGFCGYWEPDKWWQPTERGNSHHCQNAGKEQEGVWLKEVMDKKSGSSKKLQHAYLWINWKANYQLGSIYNMY